MRSHCALYVDAGYLFAATATRLTGTSLRRGIDVDHKRLIDTLATHATDASGLPLLRVHWYDAARNGVPDQTQEEIGLLPRVKIRLGRIGFDGEQKGVDLRIGLDMVAHARNAAIDVIYLVSGDDDLTEAVEEAQAHGVQVTVLAVPTKDGAPHNVSRHLQRAADVLELIDMDSLDAAVVPRADTRGPAPARLPPIASPTPTILAPKESATARLPPTPPAAASVDVPTLAALDPALAASGVVYSSTTGGPTKIASGFSGTEAVRKAIDQIVERLLETWLRGATPEQRAELIAGRPSIPRDIDRALLLDLSALLGIDDLSDEIRIELRNRFWVKVGQNGLI
jgi:uncharacterized LabA/DUF88 family protein